MKNFLDYASKMYYSGNPIMADSEFDKLAEYYNYDSVGHSVDFTDGVAHAFRMYSLQKCFVGEKLIQLPGKVVETVKLDGAAVALYYTFGKLSLALTRGDGIRGLDVTRNLVHAIGVHEELHYASSIPFMQITGELVARKEVENARNVAAGAMNLKDASEFASRGLEFIAYGVHPRLTNSWFDDMEVLRSWDMRVITWPGLENKFPTDGTVYRVDNYELFESLGYTSKHPKGAFALKEKPTGEITTLLDVKWQVGRSGVVTPVAIIEPININGATVSKATLNNAAFIKELDLEINCLVEVVRSGEIIPMIVRRVYE